MQCMSSIQKKILLVLFCMPVVTSCLAQDAANTAGKTLQPGNNQLAILLAIISIVFAFVIWGMGRVLVELGSQLVKKSKQPTQIISMLLLIGFSLLAQSSFATDAASTGAANVGTNYGGLSKTAFNLFVTVIGLEVITILFFAFSIKRMYVELLPEKPKQVEAASQLNSWWNNLDKKIFTRAIPVEKEADFLLDHNYDGIRELDNALPPWWKYGFYITIVVAFIYLLNFHVLGLGKNPTEEYAVEMENARINKEIYESANKDKVDENNVPMADAGGIRAGMEMFEANCIACHLKGGAGNVGPNITDDYWLHKGSLNDIYSSIKTGFPDKGMQSWSLKFNDKEISLLASYVKSLRGANPPDGKLPQGELYADPVTAPATDSTKKSPADSAAITKQ